MKYDKVIKRHEQVSCAAVEYRSIAVFNGRVSLSYFPATMSDIILPFGIL